LSDFINAKWALRAVERIERAIAQWAVPSISRRTLGDTLWRLKGSRRMVEDRLARNTGEGHWEMWGGAAG
jgi:hypothetical protein